MRNLSANSWSLPEVAGLCSAAQTLFDHGSIVYRRERRFPPIRKPVSIHSNLAFRGLVVPVVFPCESFVTKLGLREGG